MSKLVLVIIIFSLGLFSNEYELNKIRVKISSNSDFINDFKQNNIVEEFKDVLGEYTTNSFISDNLIFAYKKALERKNNAQFMNNELAIENIFDIEYSSKIDPQIASKKIASISDVVFAEPIYKREFFGVPNDAELENQYHHALIQTFEAWEILDTTKQIVIGIVDTGIEFDHEDLKDNIWYNPGERGMDGNGKSKESNGIDDDSNGYVDDWRGWDFALNDNDPSPGHTHGTHVAGIASGVSNNDLGIAGVALNAKLAAIKIGYDSRNSTGVVNGYQGILYAAVIGCDVINNSWGGGGGSQAEGSVLDAAADLGAVIICAAGNNGSLQAFYPAAHERVLSVASTTNNDTQSGFSNYHPSVDVSAPGSSIYATVLDGKYNYLSGTSMASPVAAGVAAMVVANFPQYSNQQVLEHIMATSVDIDNRLSTTRRGNFGKGRVNAFDALSNVDAKLVRMINYSITDKDGNNVLEPGDELTIEVEYSNQLNPIMELEYNVIGKENNNEIVIENGQIGDMPLKSNRTVSFDYILPEDLDFDYIYQIPIDLTNNNDYLSRDLISFTVNQSYRTLNQGVINFTKNSKGNMGYNDYPANEQGQGIRYKETESLMYEGAIMIGANVNAVASSARSSNQSQQDNDFYIVDVVKEEEFDNVKRLTTKFSDKGLLEVLGVEVTKTTYYINEGILENAIIMEHIIYNDSDVDYDSLFAGYYFDWDIGNSGRNDLAFWDKNNEFIIQRNEDNPDLPICALAVLSDQNAIGYALDNDGESEDNPGVYDGFTKQEKWNVLSGNIKRVLSSKTDASSIISAGPLELKSKDSVEVTFIIMISEEQDDFEDIYNAAKSKMNDLKFLSAEHVNTNFDLYPNPVNSNFVNFEFINENPQTLNIKIIDINGNLIQERSDFFNSGKIYTFEDVSKLSNGSYLLLIESPEYIKSKKFVIKK